MSPSSEASDPDEPSTCPDRKLENFLRTMRPMRRLPSEVGCQLPPNWNKIDFRFSSIWVEESERVSQLDQTINKFWIKVRFSKSSQEYSIFSFKCKLLFEIYVLYILKISLFKNVIKSSRFWWGQVKIHSCWCFQILFSLYCVRRLKYSESK